MQDYDYPPGLGNLGRPSSYGHGDTEPSQPAGGFSGYGQAERGLPPGTHYSTRSLSPVNTNTNMARSAAVHERELSLGDGWVSVVPANTNRPIPAAMTSPAPLAQHFNVQHAAFHLPASTAASSSPASLSFRDRDSFFSNRAAHSAAAVPHAPLPSHPLSAAAASSRSTLWWGELEPWMDEEYAKQVCNLMGWDPLTIKVPHPAPDSVTGQQANNPGYCFLTFPSPAHAASVLAQINSAGNGTPVTMPNSSKPFLLNWASSTPVPPSLSPTGGLSAQQQQQQQYPKEYSIFVGDLAPEASNSDLVAVFRNPVLGLRNDREPKFIRPFLSCKSAKIMLDPVTGVSRGYGFVR